MTAENSPQHAHLASPMARGQELAGNFSPPSLQVKAVSDAQDP